MAYCRFSSDDFQCDLYVYADVSGGFIEELMALGYRAPESLAKEVRKDRLK